MSIKQIVYLICLIIPSNQIFAITYEFSNGINLQISGYLGARYILSHVEFDAAGTGIEAGFITNLKLTDRLVVFNQFKYGTTVDDILVYNHIAYTPNIPINNFQLTLKGGKIWYDTTLYNITRVNPRTRQGVFQPRALYWNIFEESNTSGVGVGFDAKYKNFKLSYLIDKQTTQFTDTQTLFSDDDEKDNKPKPIKTKFGDHQLVSLGYEFPKYGVRTIAFWETSKIITSNPIPIDIGLNAGSRVGTGIEWVQDDFTASLEGICVKRKNVGWTQFSKLYCGISPTITYNINEDFSIRANYNQYRSPDNTAPQIQTYTKDINLGIGWHKGSWIANIEGHYIQGGGFIDPTDIRHHSTEYNHFYVIGTNLVYFWD